MKHIVSIILIMLVSNTTHAADIILHTTAQPKGHVVRLADVADVRAIDADRGHRLASIPLMPAPAPGTRQFVRRQQIREMLVAHGEDMASHRLRGAVQVQVGANAPSGKSAWKTIPKQMTGSRSKQIHNKVEAAIIEHLNIYASLNEPWLVAFELTDDQLRQLAEANTPVIANGGGTPWVGRQRFTLRFTTPNGPANILVATNVMLPEPVVVAVNAIPRGVIIRAADVELRRVPQKSSRRASRFEPIRQLEQVVGNETKRSIQADEKLDLSSIRSPVLVKRGDSVAIEARTGGIMVRTQARATEDGSRGDLIVVELFETRDRIAARVVGVRKVEVYAQGVDVSAYASAPAAMTHLMREQKTILPKPGPANEREWVAKQTSHDGLFQQAAKPTTEPVVRAFKAIGMLSSWE